MTAPWKLFPAAIDKGLCESSLRSMLDTTELQPGTVYSADEYDVERNFRRSRVGWPCPKKHRAIIGKTRNLIRDANRELWGLDLDGHEEWQLTHYSDSDEGGYRPHFDFNPASDAMSCRKVSASIQLSDSGRYSGGDIIFQNVGQPESLGLHAQGSIIVFPSFLGHSVTPLTRGQRFSLVAWFSGPRWR